MVYEIDDKKSDTDTEHDTDAIDDHERSSRGE